jgi:hypothetical protein
VRNKDTGDVCSTFDINIHIKFLVRKYGRKITWKTATYVDDSVKIEIKWEN